MQDIIEMHAPGSMLVNAGMRLAPFPHFVCARPLAPDVADAAYTWLDEHAPWDRHTSDFYDQFGCDLISLKLPRLLHHHLVSPIVLQRMRQRLEALFSVPLADIYSVVAHRLVPGQGIGVHTDAPADGTETYRMVVHVGPGFRDASGGHLMFFRSKDRHDAASAFRSIHNTAVGFELSERSHHAVTDIVAGVRYTLVYSFWRADHAANDIEPPAARIEGSRLVPVGRARVLQETRRAPHASAGRTLASMIDVLVRAGAARTPCARSVLLPHLVHTYELLRAWHCSDAVCLAGLFHGVYGTEPSPHQTIPLHQRDLVRDTIGEHAERLAHAYCAASRVSLQRALVQGDPGLVEDRWQDAPLGLDDDGLAALATMLYSHSAAGGGDESNHDDARLSCVSVR